MKILSIDPGYGRCGAAVVEGNASSQTREFSECIETNSENTFPDRLEEICNRVNELIHEHEPETLAIEKLFFNQNTTTAMKVAQVKGAIILVAKENGLNVFEYAPLEIKTAITGHGRAKKAQVIQMTDQFVDMRDDAKHDDEYDAVAVGITCLAHEG